MRQKIYRQGLKVLKASIAVVSNRQSLLLSFPLDLEVKSLLTDFKEVVETSFPADPDGGISITEIPGAKPSFKFAGRQAIFRGPFMNLTRRASDPRYTLWGNQGFFYRFTLYLLEKNHRIWSFHACALFDHSKNILYIVAGGAGSGKTVYLLNGIEKGLEVFSTETVHFAFQGKRVVWFMGSLADNVRVETLRRHFPRFPPSPISPDPEVPWLGKIALDLHRFRCQEERLIDPETVILLPRVEEGQRHFELTPLKSPSRAVQVLFANISQKLAETVLLYDVLPVPGLDNPELAEARRRAVERLVQSRNTRLIASVLSSPETCWGDLLADRTKKRRKK